MNIQMLHGDSIDVLKNFPDNSIDAVVADPPYGLGREPDPVKLLQAWITHGFYEVKGRGMMDKKWDAFVPQPALWKEVFRVLKPGGHLLSFFGTRTQDWGTIALRLAGFEIRDSLGWVHSGGMSKGMDISKKIDQMAGATREVVGVVNNAYDGATRRPSKHKSPAETSNTGRWGMNETPHGRPLTAPSTDEAKKWEGWKTTLRPMYEPITLARKPIGEKNIALNVLTWGTGGLNIDASRIKDPSLPDNPGRFPVNLIHDGSDEVTEIFPIDHLHKPVSRFFYCAKPGKSERGAYNNHSTVKPIALMKYLCNMITPPGGVVLDPFMGSGTTGLAAISEGFQFVGIEREEEYVEIARRRLEEFERQPLLL